MMDPQEMPDSQVKAILARYAREFASEGEFIEEYQRLFLKVALHRRLISLEDVEAAMWKADELIQSNSIATPLSLIDGLRRLGRLGSDQVGSLHAELLRGFADQ